MTKTHLKAKKQFRISKKIQNFKNILALKNKAIKSQCSTNMTCRLKHQPKLSFMNKSTFQPSNEHDKWLIRVMNNLINFKFATIVHVSKIKKN